MEAVRQKLAFIEERRVRGESKEWDEDTELLCGAYNESWCSFAENLTVSFSRWDILLAGTTAQGQVAFGD